MSRFTIPLSMVFRLERLVRNFMWKWMGMSSNIICGLEGAFSQGRRVQVFKILLPFVIRYLKQTENYGLETFIIIFRYWKVNTGEA
ncbi:uncharacterized protein LOC130781853 isoform X4 [Actinidia eriantha]|uniref:uncharacterized protein LOC130781853 isoform X4 n=1 Tax=Actinidia eriantha TaxID=165200 RepID=UPI002587CD51|nr:uncharacterized protein LOC130781853 isoform X4 [Actinidia eriantha]